VSREPLTPRMLLVIFTVSMCSFQAGLNLSIMNVAFPDLQRSWPDASRASLSWVLSVYTIVTAATMIPAGVVADRVGHRRIALIGLATFVIGSSTGALSPNVSVLIVGRVVQAVGGAMLGPAAVALLLDAVPATRRTFAMSIWSAVGSVATASGPSLGAWLVDIGGWRWAFWTGVPFGIVAWVLGFRTFEERRVADRRFPDPWSSALLLVGIGSLTLALVQSRTWGWSSPSTLAAFATSAATLSALALRSSRIASPLIDPALLRFSGVRYAVSGAVLYGAGFFALFFGAIQFLSFVWEYDTMQAGLLFVATPASMVVMSPIAGRLAERLGLGMMLVIAGLFTIAGACTMGLALGADRHVAPWITGMVLFGIGGSFAWPALFGLVAEGLPPSLFAQAMGVQQAFQRIAGALGVAATITLTDAWRPGDGVGDYVHLWYLVGAAGIAALLIGARSWQQSRSRDQFASDPP
jgi:EmrB/QacA subfamily drug resistance transporter